MKSSQRALSASTPAPMSLGALAIIAALFSRPASSQETNVVMRPVLPPRPVVTLEARARAQGAYEEARRRYAAGDMAEALAAAEDAWRAVPNASTALIRATILGKLSRHEEAFEALLVAADLRPTEGEREQIESLLARHGSACSPARGWVAVDVSPGDVDVTVRGVRFRGSRTVGPTGGAHLFRAEGPGHAASEAIVTVIPGRGVKLRLATGTPSGDAPVPRASPRRRGQRVLPWVLLGGGAAVLGAAIGLNVWAMDALRERDAASHPNAYLTDEERHSRYEEADSAMRKRGISAYCLYGVGGAAVVAGAVLLLLPERGRVGGTAPMPFASGDGWGNLGRSGVLRWTGGTAGPGAGQGRDGRSCRGKSRSGYWSG